MLLSPKGQKLYKELELENTVSKNLALSDKVTVANLLTFFDTLIGDLNQYYEEALRAYYEATSNPSNKLVQQKYKLARTNFDQAKEKCLLIHKMIHFYLNRAHWEMFEKTYGNLKNIEAKSFKDV